MTMDFVYHTGHLAVDRDLKDDDGTRTGAADLLHEKATRLMWAAETGKAILYQKRCKYGFEYHCVPVKGA